jgi:carbon storage regulator
MLVLSRKTGQRVRIGDNVWLTAIRCQEGRVRFGIEAPAETPIHREEVLERIASAAAEPVSGPAETSR